jgi:hypothetical protein
MNEVFPMYLDHVESRFFQLKGRPGQLSPRDFERVKQWFEAGVPLGAVLEGIAEAFGAQAASRDREAEEVNSLAYCEPFVDAALKRRPL